MEVLDTNNAQNGTTTVPGQDYKTQSPAISIGEWVLTMLILAIPIVNIVMLFVWAFGSDTSQTKANFAKASLIWMLISIVLVISMFSTIAGMMAVMMNSLN